MLRVVVFILTVVGTLFFSSARFVDPYLIPKWCVLLVGLALWGTAVALQGLYPFDKSSSRFSSSSFIIIGMVAALFAEACCGIWQALPFAGISSVTGTFDNSAGFAASLCAGFPFCLYGATVCRGWRRGVFVAIAVVLAVAVLLSASRAGVLSLLAVGAVWLWRRLRLSAKVKWMALVLLLASASVVLYFIKKDSADGRLLIWRCSWEMMADKPLLGWGIGGFEAHYMDYQAAYFAAHPDSRYALLADTVQYPFSEYLNVGVTFGAVGLLAVAFLLVCLLHCYLRKPTAEKESGILCWLAVAVFAAFSYPLMYASVWLMLAYATFLLLKDVLPVSLPSSLRRAGAICLLAFSLWTGIKVCHRVRSELAWAEAVSPSVPMDSGNRLEQYRHIYPMLRTDRYFLYNYASVLSQCGEYERSLSVALECRRRWADYDLELLLADLYEYQGDASQAESHYRHASLMCPNRFVPLFRLVQLLDKEGRVVEAKELARRIVDKPVKVPSALVEQIKKRMNDYSNQISER